MLVVYKLLLAGLLEPLKSTLLHKLVFFRVHEVIRLHVYLFQLLLVGLGIANVDPHLLQQLHFVLDNLHLLLLLLCFELPYLLVHLLVILLLQFDLLLLLPLFGLLLGLHLSDHLLLQIKDLAPG